jgi:hypothetical protein
MRWGDAIYGCGLSSECKNTRDSRMKLNGSLMNAFVYASKHIALVLMEMKTSDSQ